MKKKMIKTIAIFAILVLSINMMGGCVLDKTGMVNPSTNLMSGVIVKAELTDQEVVGYLVDQDMRKSINTFSAALFNQTLEDAKGENLLVSPISVLYAMSMCTNGADENTRHELLKALIKGNGNEEITCGTTIHIRTTIRAIIMISDRRIATLFCSRSARSLILPLLTPL